MENSIYLLSAVGAVCAAWFIWTDGIKVLFLDGMRERLFEIRFELFRLGTSGELPYDNEAYRAVETLICGLLRFGHRITFLTFLLSIVEIAKARKDKNYVDVSQQIGLKISRLQPSTQVKVAKILKDTHSTIVVYTALSSLFFLTLMATTKVCKLLGLWHSESTREKVSHVIEREAYLAETRRGMRLAVA
jgi:hypothetical protein